MNEDARFQLREVRGDQRHCLASSPDAASVVRCADIKPYVEEWIRLGGTQELLAELAGVSEKTIRHVLQGRRTVFLDTADRILVALGVTHADFQTFIERGLSEDQVREIRALMPLRYGQAIELGRRYGVHSNTVWKAANGVTWGNL